MSADSIGRRFLQTVLPLIRSSDRPKLIAVLGREWPSEGLVQFLRSSRGDVVKTAAVCLGLVGTTRHCRPLAAVLHHGDRQAVRFAERGLWSIWMKAGSRPGRRQLARASRMIQQEELEASVAELRELTAVEAHFAEGHHQLGIAQSLLDRPRAAAAAYRRAISLMPQHFAACTGLGSAYVALGDFVAALSAYQRAMRIHPRLEGAVELIERTQTAAWRRAALA